MATTQNAIPPGYQIVKSGTEILQASDSMADWMRRITTQAAAAMAALPDGTVTHTGDTLPDNAIVLGSGSSEVTTIPDAGTTPGDVLVSQGPGQTPRWMTLTGAVITPLLQQLAGTQQVGTGPLPVPVSPEQQQIINHVVFLLHELIRISKAT